MDCRLKRLTALAVKQAARRGYYADGGGLYLQVSASGAKSWVFRFRDAGRLREMGLGPEQTVTLAEARKAATQCREQRLARIDPIAARRAAEARDRLQAAKAMTFRLCAEAYIAAHRGSWKNAKHVAQWFATLATYAYPVIGNLPVQTIEVGHVRKILDPIWGEKTETASRLRGRMEAVIDWATVAGYRQGDNPARWRGFLDKMLPPRARTEKTRHLRALPYAEVGAFLESLHGQPGTAALALEFLILTATCTNETLGVRWGEIDLAKKTWTIPGERMKAGREHRVPLSPEALAMLVKLQATGANESDYVFPGRDARRPLSNMAMLVLLRRMKRPDLTVHGFRSTFRDWAAEHTNFPREVCEQALAHSLPDKVEAAYLRSDLFEKRRRLMDAWARYCATSPAQSAGTIISLQTA
jgi:integrase